MRDLEDNFDAKYNPDYERLPWKKTFAAKEAYLKAARVGRRQRRLDMEAAEDAKGRVSFSDSSEQIEIPRNRDDPESPKETGESPRKPVKTKTEYRGEYMSPVSESEKPSSMYNYIELRF